MANDRLILRTSTVPWILDIPDLTKGSVLTHTELDSNFIHLKGEVIDEVTLDESGVITLHKINGKTLTYDNGQNNIIYSNEYNINTGDDIVDVINDDVNGLIVGYNDIFIIKTNDGLETNIYFFKPGKGVWGASVVGGTPIDSDDLISITSVSNSESNNFSRTINVNKTVLENCITCTSTDIKDRIAEYVNSLNYLKSDTDADVWVTFDDENGIFTTEFNNVFQ